MPKSDCRNTRSKMQMLARLVYTTLALIGLSSTVGAQWLALRTPDIPRNADGTPNLNARPLRTPDGHPDLQGVWLPARTAIAPPDGVLQPWVEAAVRAHQEEYLKTRPSFLCLPSGPEVNVETRRIMQSPSQIAVLHESQSFRTIFLDGRRLEPDPYRTWMGYSVGRWEGDTLVVESFGFNDRTWLNPIGLPHTEQLRLVERYTRPTFGRMHIELTISDPGAFTRAWTAEYGMTLRTDTEMLETVCEADSKGWTGSLSDARAAAVLLDPSALRRYVGVYAGAWGTIPRTVRVTLSGDSLHVNGILGEDVELIPQSSESFAGTNGLTYEFTSSETAQASQLIERHVSGDYTYARQDR